MRKLLIIIGIMSLVSCGGNEALLNRINNLEKKNREIELEMMELKCELANAGLTINSNFLKCVKSDTEIVNLIEMHLKYNH